jgi:4-amino-4-deoxy-L-arabinose transferase-like glycosyltransferase
MSTTIEPPTTEIPAVGGDPEPTAATSGRLPRGAEHLAVVPVLALAAVLNIYRLSRNDYGNPFYSAGIKSMLVSLHNFFFVSFDPGGLVTIDKPPIGLWLQALSAKLFGFTPLALLLPQAIGGVIAVGVLYAIVARRYGVTGAVLAGLALAVFPSFVAVSRDNNLDTTLILLMLLACGAGLLAVERGRLMWLLVSALFVGLAFNTKTLAAYLIIPGLALAYGIGAPGTLWRRAAHLLAAGALMLLVSAAWMVVVDNTSAAKRPYVGGSTNDTEWNLTTEYNGVGRVGGQTGGPGQVPRIEQLPAGERAPAPARPSRQALAAARVPRHKLVSFGGPTGPLRLFDDELADQGAWLLPFALAGLVALALLVAPRRRRDPHLAFLLVMGGWFLAELFVLSFGQGIIHPYYVSALGPGVAAMAGAGAVAMTRLSARGGARRAIPLIALAVTALVQIVLLQRKHDSTWLIPVIVALIACACLLALRRLSSAAVIVGFAGLLAAPLVVSASTWTFRVEGTFPAAGPTASAGRSLAAAVTGGIAANPLLAWVQAHHPGTRWAVLTDASDVAAPLILEGSRAGALGGYGGTDPAIGGVALAHLVDTGQARFMLMGGVDWDRGGNDATRTIINACRLVPTAVWHAGAPGTLRHTMRLSRYAPLPTATTLALYDCRGRTRAMREVAPRVAPAP